MSFQTISRSPKAQNAIAILVVILLLFAVLIAAKSGLLSAGYDWLSQSLTDVPHRLVTSLPFSPERF